jgi:transglutaminase-like putative cysteine protease
VPPHACDRRLVKLDVGCSMSLRALWATPAVLMLRPRSGESQWVIAERYQIEPPTPVSEFTDAHGNLCQRIVVPQGAMTISVEATVDTADEIDVDVTAPRVPIEFVPDWALQFLLPSRYCQSDLVFTNAVEITRGALPGYPQVEAIRSWIAQEVRYEYGTSSAVTSAVDTLYSRAGVCRDFAHLGIAMCRSLDIPARMVVGYLHGLDPMDQHAWFEAYVGGRWFTFDATQHEPRGNRVTIAYGRDAADVAFVTQFGPVELEEMFVFVRESTDVPAVDTGPYVGDT